MNKALRLLLQAADVSFINVLWCDYANIIRGKAFHRNLFSDGQEYPVSISRAQLGVSACGDYVVPNSPFQPIGEIFLCPDWDTVRLLPFLPGYASVYGEMVSTEDEEIIDPRIFLKNTLQNLQNYGINFKVAFENEFTLLDSSTEKPIDEALFASPQATIQNSELILSLCNALESQGLFIERYYPESGFGQYEITTKYTDAVEAADNQLLFRQTVHGVSRQYGYKATFVPKYSESQSGNGCHVHFSLWREGINLFDDACRQPQNRDIAESFIAGIIEHLPGLMVLTTPSPNSYRRIKPHSWSGAYACWGIDNREAALRAITVPINQGDKKISKINHFELKTCDATANPYLALSGLLLCGISGIENKRSLNKPVQQDPGFLSDEQLATLQVKKLPTCLSDSLEAFCTDNTFAKGLGKQMMAGIIAVREEELRQIGKLDFEEEFLLLKERY
jgi:glutamine synthetase